MITNDRQYKIVKSQIQEFTIALDEFSSYPENSQNVHPTIIAAQRDAIISKLNELQKEIHEYDALKEGKILVEKVKNLKDLPLVLIKSRIANGLTQSDLARLLEIKEQQIQRYEAEMYDSASLKTMVKIADALKIRLNADVLIKDVIAPDMYDLKKYPFKQMFQRRWFSEFKGTLNEAVKNSATLIAELYDSAGIQNFKGAFNRRSIRTNSNVNDYALNIWYAKVIVEAQEQELDTFFVQDKITDEWIRNLAVLSVESNGPKLAVEYLKSSGIRVVIEPSLEGMLLDGAALLLNDMYPVIALTLRHDRLDNFWFVIFHELAHVVLHLGANYNMIFDDLDTNTDGIEKEADTYALNAIIPEKIWKKSLVRFTPSAETIKNQARALNIHPALIAGRIRRETGKYFQFTDLIGQGEVRNNFGTDFNN